jgi:hypothetical protein
MLWVERVLLCVQVFLTLVAAAELLPPVFEAADGWDPVKLQVHLTLRNMARDAVLRCPVTGAYCPFLPGRVSMHWTAIK